MAVKEEEKLMSKSFKAFAACCALLSLLAVGADSKKAPVEPPQQYPVLDKLADKISQKYQQSTCEDLWQKKSKKTPPSPDEQKVIGLLKSDPQMRTEFINRVAPAIANKMFDCGMIP